MHFTNRDQIAPTSDQSCMRNRYRLFLGLICAIFLLVSCRDHDTNRTTDKPPVEAPVKNKKESADDAGTPTKKIESDPGRVANKKGGPPKVRLRLTDPGLGTYPLLELKAEIKTVRSFGYFFGEKAIAVQHGKFVREKLGEAASPGAYFPLRAGLKWKYRKLVYVRYGVRHKNDPRIHDVAHLYYSRRYVPTNPFDAGMPPDKPVQEVRGRYEVELGIEGASENPKKFHETYILGKPEVQDGIRKFPVQVLMRPAGSVSRYGSTAKSWSHGEFTSVVWYVKTDADRITAQETVAYREYPSSGGTERVIQSTSRPLLFNAPGSIVWTYEEPSDAVRMGYMAHRAEYPVVTDAGTFEDCIRVIEYVLEKNDAPNSTVRPATPPEENVNRGWYTVSWYARGVGLVAELQLDRAGVVTYWMTLQEYSKQE